MELARCLAKGKGMLKDSGGGGGKRQDRDVGRGGTEAKSSRLNKKAIGNKKESEFSFPQRQ